MMEEWRWVKRAEALEIHKRQIERFGGSSGVRDEGLLDSALSRPRNLAAYEGIEDPVRLAASYGYGIARNHPFVDGNKRSAFVTAAFFLRLQGLRVRAEQQDVVSTILALASGTLPEDQFAEWLRGTTVPLNT